MPPDVAAEVESQRGYSDIASDDYWGEWEHVRFTLIPGEDNND